MRRQSTADAGMCVFAIVVFLAILGGVTHKARAQDNGGYDSTGRVPDGKWGEGHGERHDWYAKLKSPSPRYSGYSCCAAMQRAGENGVTGDCRPTRARLDDNGHWIAMLEGDWVPVPDDVVLSPEANHDPIYAHICASLTSKAIYCFIPAGAGI